MGVDEHFEATGLSRRDLLKRSAVVGGLVWIAPTVLASPASATVVTCTPERRFAIKHLKDGTCLTPGTNVAVAGNCAAKGGFTAFHAGCCLENPGGVITFTSSNGGNTHTYHLPVGVGFAAAFVYCGGKGEGDQGTAQGCWPHQEPHNEHVTEDANPDGSTTVVMTCTTLVHSELIVCMSGSNVPGCP